MILHHYSDVNFVFDPTREYSLSLHPDYESAFAKPNGFWVSVEGPDDWYRWCIDNEFNWIRLDSDYIVELSEEANILYLRTLDDARIFQDKYGHFGELYRSQQKIIAWDRVRYEYQGIIIPEYLYQLRWDTYWYSGWDVASGCIWDLTAIKSLTLNAKTLA